jgi:hypothetical protein
MSCGKGCLTTNTRVEYREQSIRMRIVPPEAGLQPRYRFMAISRSNE